MSKLKQGYWIGLIAVLFFSCDDRIEPSSIEVEVEPGAGEVRADEEQVSEEDLVEMYLVNGAWKHHYPGKEWDEWINKGLEINPNIAYFWQQKALPYWKQRKYSLAISCFNKAVVLDRRQWLSRLGYLKCVFAKDYEGALHDLVSYSQ
jgi:tetratricopeptide (TPR) repeat protein